ncbi:hypothetical protein CAPTEDRAFT_195424 [Capitella teleta]|uniref:WSC domain-containing protein n=1 Tax=Capitella teleta TaxID=283909 RepID=R7TU24_CAPTE|nr:hypothetical protein CAPTEDRAFT_195424 [Capitella teleta]|eukprot:ELT94520.1 hypothetical protein CAPTEDRAFT_195424 [Capitella teleta]
MGTQHGLMPGLREDPGYGTRQELHQNQGCFFTRNIFNDEKYVLESSVGDQSGCISHCINNGYAYSGLTKDSSTSFLCYCGHELPFRDERDDEKCRAKCPNGKSICGYKDYARIIANKDTFGDLPWADGYPQPDNKICIRAQKNNDEIELITADCDDRLPFICVSSDELTSTAKPESTFAEPVMSQTAESTTVLIATSTNQSDNSPMDSNAISTGVIVGAAVGGILAIIILVAIVLIVLFLRKRRRLKSSSNGRPSTKDDGNQGEENAAHVYDEIPDDRMAANSAEASHEYENVNARTHNKSPQNIVAGIQANRQTANARSQHNDRHYVNMETAGNLNEQQSDQYVVMSY